MSNLAIDLSPTWSAIAKGTKRNILVTASRLFWQHGYRGTTTREIASMVGIQQPSLFHFFPNKASIMDTLLSISLDDTLKISEIALRSAGSPCSRLHAYLMWDLEELHTMPYVLAGVHNVDILTTPGFEEWAEKSRQLYSNLQELISQGIGAGEFPEQDVKLAQEAVAWHVLAHISFHAEGLTTNPRQHAKYGADFIIRGLGGGTPDD